MVHCVLGRTGSTSGQHGGESAQADRAVQAPKGAGVPRLLGVARIPETGQSREGTTILGHLLLVGVVVGIVDLHILILLVTTVLAGIDEDLHVLILLVASVLQPRLIILSSLENTLLRRLS